MALEDKQQQTDETETVQSSSAVSHLTEIIVDILLRLPVDSLLRCQSVCKSWYSIIYDPTFVKSHLSTRNNHHKVIFTTGPRAEINIKACSLYDLLHDNYINVLEFDYLFKDPSKLVHIVGSCNGLLCMAIEDDSLVVCNPITRKSTMLLLEFDREKRHAKYVSYGFGYEELNDDYKAVRVCYHVKDRSYRTCFEICSLERNGCFAL